MTEHKPFWRDGILWVYSEYYKSYIANYCPYHHLHLGMTGIKEVVE